MAHAVEVLVGNGRHPSGAPAQVKMTITLDWGDVLKMVREGKMPEKVMDDIAHELLHLPDGR